ncbi:hypothetical protein MKQ68_23210 [Chitinophaga horti]|uniref:DUF4843 domain-containing protein n=1 Tax=Chitinophaga horti TaxID=2920382 RepID=A0ABY6IZZ3_9BACT|nr:hypothetical protein [Chitinophaga horti]UYQ92993.1 hypothetical protein MKQ68_23210 [Chitinophaga horti]
MKTNATLKLYLLLTTLFISFSACKDKDEAPMGSKAYQYMVNTGKYGAAYVGSHAMTIATEITVEELPAGKSRIVVLLTNTTMGKTYQVNFYTAMEGSAALFEQIPKYTVAVTGNGPLATASTIVSDSFDKITTEWKGYAVVHDPGQTYSATNFATFLIIGKMNMPE